MIKNPYYEMFKSVTSHSASTRRSSRNGEKEMLDLNKPIETKDGRSVRIVCTDAKTRFSLVGLVTRDDGKEFVGLFTPTGFGSHGLDLLNVPLVDNSE